MALLNPENRRKLLALARSSVEAVLNSEDLPDRPESRETPAEFDLPCGAFVSLHRKDQLRGCVGIIEAARPLWDTIRNAAVSAAFRDPRFEPVDLAELKELHFEISVLSPMERVHDISEIQVGRHGLYLRRGPHSGLLLPQVAIEWRWDRETFLKNVAKKAGLAGDGWRDPSALLYRFTAEVFSDSLKDDLDLDLMTGTDNDITTSADR